MRLPEQQVVADFRHVFTIAYHLEIPRTVFGIAIHHRADQLVILQHQLLVNTSGGIMQHDVFGIFITGKVTGRK